MVFSGVKDVLLHWLLPETCAHCKEDLPFRESLLCQGCRGLLSPFQPPYCLLCAAPMARGRAPCPCSGATSACDLIRAAFFYRGSVVSLVHAFKYRGRRPAARLAGNWMARTLPRFSELETFDALVPMPLHPRRLAERGYNQARLLAEEIATATRLPVLELIERRAATRAQWRLGRRERAMNVAGAFAMSREAAHAAVGKSLLLIDDVCTSAASLKECARLLRLAGARRVCGYVFARQ